MSINKSVDLQVTLAIVGREFWRFVVVQEFVTKLAQTAIDYPPMQAPASFNLEAVKQEINERIRGHEGQ
jgi:arylsulfatase